MKREIKLLLWRVLCWLGKRKPEAINAFLSVTATIVIAAATVTNCSVTGRQQQTMQAQLNEMQVQSLVQKTELKPVLSLTIDREVRAGWAVLTPKWTNSGRSDAKEVKGWAVLASIAVTGNPAEKREAVNTHDFMSPPPGSHPMEHGVTIIPGEGRSEFSQFIPPRGIQANVDQTTAFILYGYVEYIDVFGTKYTARFCRDQHFELQPTGEIAGTLPFPLEQLPCEGRTETQPK